MEKIEKIVYFEFVLFFVFATIAFIFGMYNYDNYSMMFLGFVYMIVGSIVISIYLLKLCEANK